MIHVSKLKVKRECDKKYHYEKLYLRKDSQLFSFLKETQTNILELIKNANINLDNWLKKRFDEKSFLKDWFHIEKEWRQERDYYISIFKRFIVYMRNQYFEILKTDVTYQVNLDTTQLPDKTVIGNVSMIVQKGKFTEAIIMHIGKPTLSNRARKKINKPENNLELFLAYLGLKEKYPGIKVSFYHLKNKDDRRKKIVSIYENQKGKNIVTANFGGLNDQYILEKLNELLDMDIEKDCISCSYFNLCKAQPIRIPKKKIIEEKRNAPIQLNNKQQQVVNHINSSMRVIAGAGSGKTTVLKERLVKLLENGISHQDILFLTFTNKAANEIRDRVMDRLQRNYNLPKISTYNSFGYELLKKHSSLLGYDNLKIASKIDRYSIIEELLGAIEIENISYYDLYNHEYGIIPKIDKVLSHMLDNNLISKHPLIPIAAADMHVIFKLPIETICEISSLAFPFKKKMEERELITYSEQILLTNKLFEDYPDLLEEYRNKFKYIMVDEFQDTNPEQSKLVFAIASHGNIVIVGDDDQAIFEWRRADNTNILNFNKHFKCIDVIMDDNYRSSPDIIHYANKLIKNNKDRFGKKLISHKKSNFKSKILMDSDYDTVFGEIVQLMKEGYNPGDIAIIGRTNKVLYAFSEKLKSNGIPFNLPKNYLIDTTLFKTLYNYLSLVLEPDNQHSNIFLYDILSKHYSLHDYELDNRHKDVPLYEHLLSINSPSIEKYLDDLSLVCSFKKPLTLIKTLSSRLFNITEHPVIDAIESIIESYNISTTKDLYDIFKYFILCSDETTVDGLEEPNNVSLLTAHSAKGKEFPAVIIIKSNDFRFKKEKEKEEARRLLYVALTRAKTALIITHFKDKKNIVSPFIDELIS